ncbi:hypothetical protein CBR_g38109 [Chara braunii]|uniref:Uncharacterized protein n=1 Tax=Chara braunii TaxID=69332 RepID=A0A388LPI0_CHABU|nr:hypothetical protein CBR_g38109 [Chara braunii]|eukprot:GBG84135.1 hypothetical protein CBR_g38109 [Chara braunii]
MAVAAGASGIGQIQRQALGLGLKWTEAVDDGKGNLRSRHHQTDLQIPSCSGSCAWEARTVSHYSFVRLTGPGGVQEHKPPSLSCPASSFRLRRWPSSSSLKRGTRRVAAVTSTIIAPVWRRGGKQVGRIAPCRAASMSGSSSAQEDQAKEEQQGMGVVDGRNFSSPLSDYNEEGKEEDQGMEPADGTNLSAVGQASIASPASSPPPPPPPAAAIISPVLSIPSDTESDTKSDTESDSDSDKSFVAAAAAALDDVSAFMDNVADVDVDNVSAFMDNVAAVLDNVAVADVDNIAAVVDNVAAFMNNVAAVVDNDAPGLDNDMDSSSSVVREPTNGSYVQLAVDLVGKSDDDSVERIAAMRESSTAEEADVSQPVRTSVDAMTAAHSDTDTDTDTDRASTAAASVGKRSSDFQQPTAAASGRNERDASSSSGASAGRRAKRRRNISDYMRIVSDYLKYEKGPPRWLAPIDAEPQRADAPLMLFLPGIEGTGFSLLLQHESLKRYFELWCLSIPPSDRTPFGELVDLVRTTVETEHKLNPGRAIYLLGESFGGSLALAAASELQDVYLHLILINPGDPLRLATAGFEGSLQLWDRIWNIRDRLVQMLPELGVRVKLLLL